MALIRKDVTVSNPAITIESALEQTLTWLDTLRQVSKEDSFYADVFFTESKRIFRVFDVTSQTVFSVPPSIELTSNSVDISTITNIINSSLSSNFITITQLPELLSGLVDSQTIQQILSNYYNKDNINNIVNEVNRRISDLQVITKTDVETMVSNIISTLCLNYDITGMKTKLDSLTDKLKSFDTLAEYVTVDKLPNFDSFVTEEDLNKTLMQVLNVKQCFSDFVKTEKFDSLSVALENISNRIRDYDLIKDIVVETSKKTFVDHENFDLEMQNMYTSLIQKIPNEFNSKLLETKIADLKTQVEGIQTDGFISQDIMSAWLINLDNKYQTIITDKLKSFDTPTKEEIQELNDKLNAIQPIDVSDKADVAFVYEQLLNLKSQIPTNINSVITELNDLKHAIANITPQISHNNTTLVDDSRFNSIESQISIISQELESFILKQNSSINTINIVFDDLNMIRQRFLELPTSFLTIHDVTAIMQQVPTTTMVRELIANVENSLNNFVVSTQQKQTLTDGLLSRLVETVESLPASLTIETLNQIIQTNNNRFFDKNFIESTFVKNESLASIISNCISPQQLESSVSSKIDMDYLNTVLFDMASKGFVNSKFNELNSKLIVNDAMIQDIVEMKSLQEYLTRTIQMMQSELNNVNITIETRCNLMELINSLNVRLTEYDEKTKQLGLKYDSVKIVYDAQQLEILSIKDKIRELVDFKFDDSMIIPEIEMAKRRVAEIQVSINSINQTFARYDLKFASIDTQLNGLMLTIENHNQQWNILSSRLDDYVTKVSVDEAYDYVMSDTFLNELLIAMNMGFNS